METPRNSGNNKSWLGWLGLLGWILFIVLLLFFFFYSTISTHNEHVYAKRILQLQNENKGIPTLESKLGKANELIAKLEKQLKPKQAVIPKTPSNMHIIGTTNPFRPAIGKKELTKKEAQECQINPNTLATEKELANLRLQLTLNGKDLEAKNSEIEKLQTEVSLAKKNLAGQTAGRAKLRQQVADLKKQLAQAGNDLKTATAAAAQLRSQVQELQTGKDNALADATNEIGELEAAQSDLKDEITSRQSLIKNLKTELAKSQAAYAILQSSQTKSKNEIASKRSQIENLQTELAKSQAENTKSKQDIALVVTNNATQRNEINKLKGDLALLEKLVAELKRAIAASRPELIASVYFKTGVWRLTAVNKTQLVKTALELSGYTSDDYVCVIAGRSDPQRFAHNHKRNNLDLSTYRSAECEHFMFLQHVKLPPITIAGKSDVYAPAQPVDNPDERVVNIYIKKKNPPDPGKILAAIQAVLSEK